MSDEQDKPPLEAFLEQYRKDREARSIQTLTEYLAAFPGDEDGVGRAYFRLQDGDATEAQVTDADSIGSYKIEHELGRGGQGIVYLADDTRLNRKVALKVPCQPVTDTEED